MSDTDPEHTDFDHAHELRRAHEQLSYIPEHIEKAQTELFDLFEAIHKDKEDWQINANLNKVDDEIEATQELLNEFQDQLDTIKDAVPEDTDD
jgi:chromosome segregation ATPase